MSFSKLKNLKVFTSSTTGEVPSSTLLEYDYIYINIPDSTIWVVEVSLSTRLLRAVKISRPIEDFLTADQVAALDAADGPTNLNPFITESARKAFASYTGFVTQATVSTTSGLLVVGRTYVIDSLVAGDNFANVGYVSEGADFVATGTTPTVWANSTIVINQTSSAPTIQLLEDEVTGVTWQRTAVGTYLIKKTGAFTALKTVPIDDQYTDIAGNLFKLYYNDADSLTLESYAAANTAVKADDVLSSRYINIEIYK